MKARGKSEGSLFWFFFIYPRIGRDLYNLHNLRNVTHLTLLMHADYLLLSYVKCKKIRTIVHFFRVLHIIINCLL